MEAQLPLLVFSDDWGRHPSSCQHLVERLLDRHPVCWVNTIGTRAPRFDRATMDRGTEKLGHWLRGRSWGSSREQGPSVLNPWMWPGFRSPLARKLNRMLLTRQLAPVIERLDSAPVAITTVPLIADLVGRLRVCRWVYYCVDDFAEWPGLDRRALSAMHEQLVASADVRIAASAALQGQIAALGRPAHLLTHGVDLELWKSPRGAGSDRLAGLERPLVVFWGLIDQRMDLDFLRRLSADLERGTILLVGPQDHPEPGLLEIPRVRGVGPVPRTELPQLAAEAAVLVMPYNDSPATRAMQPLKLGEYLASGRPVVARDLPANREWSDALDLAATPEAFSRSVRERIAGGLLDAQRAARRRLESESWTAKAAQFERWIVP